MPDNKPTPPPGYTLHPTPLPNLSPAAPAPVQRQVKPVSIKMAKPEDKTGIAIEGNVYGDLTGMGQAPHAIVPKNTSAPNAIVGSDPLPQKAYSVAELKAQAAKMNPAK